MRLFAALILAVALAASAVIAVTIGPADISVAEALRAALYHLGLAPDTPLAPLRDAIVWDLRLPRIVAAIVAGAGLSLCGAALQAITRNPLAEPYLLGVSSGAALGAVACLMAGATLLMPLGAFAGSLATLALALAIARALGGATPSRAILVGICLGALASALTSCLIFWSATGDSYREILAWLMGSLSGATWGDAGLVAAALVVSAPLILASGRDLDGFTFGETAAAGLGIDVARLRWTLLVATALLTGVIVAIGGAIGFVGLVVPHVAQLIVGSGHRRLLPLAMVLGALFMLWADTAARSLFAPRELPVGMVTALFGAPAFLAVLVRYRRLT